MSIFKKSLFLCISFTLLVSLSGCNTVKGFGTDIQKGGQAISEAASR